MKINALKVKELPNEHVFKKDNPYIIDKTFSKYDFEKKGEQITGYNIFEIDKKLLSYYMYTKMGLSESSLNTITKPFSFLSHCKLSFDSPCCKSLCGDDNHCICNVDTHEYISDSEEEHIEKK